MSEVPLYTFVPFGAGQNPGCSRVTQSASLYMGTSFARNMGELPLYLAR